VNKLAAFKACYSEWKLIKTRQVVQVVFEVPLKDHDEAYQALGGMPDPSKERWFAIAALDLSNVAQAPATRETDSDLAHPSATVSRPRKPVAADQRLAQQAGIACADPLFRRFINAETEADAATYVRQSIGVASRAEIIPGTPEGEAWQNLYGEFLVWRDAPDLSSRTLPAPRLAPGSLTRQTEAVS